MASKPREEGPSVQQSIQGPNEGTKSVDNLMKDAEQPVYKGCKNFSILSFIRQLYHLKCLNGWCDESFTMLLQLLQDMLPSDAKVPKDSYEFEKIVKDLGLSNEKSHACPSGCMLLEKGNSNDEACSASNSSLRGIQISSEEYRQRKEEAICEPKAGLSNMMEQMASFIQGMQQQSRTGFQGIDVGSDAQDKQHPHTQGSSVASHENEQQGNKTI
uniref:Uncharacterized protein n=1 Tax=Quercus lobata TaxID=97700 RepID=A0A7N2RAN8_QUELO